MKKTLLVIASILVLFALMLFASSIFQVYQGGTGKNTWTNGIVRVDSNVMSSAELSGDVSTSGSNATTLASVVTAGSCGDATHSCGLTYDAKGRITAATNNSITGGGGGGGGGVCTAGFSSLTGWTWANQGTSTATISSNVLTFSAQNVFGQDQDRFLYLSAPSTPWTYTMCFVADLFGFDGKEQMGLAVSDGTHVEAFGIRDNNPNNLFVYQYGSLNNAFANTKFSVTVSAMNAIAIQVNNDGTNLNYSVCPDGNANHCRVVYSEGLVTWFGSGVTRVGIFGDAINLTPGVIYVYSFQ